MSITFFGIFCHKTLDFQSRELKYLLVIIFWTKFNLLQRLKVLRSITQNQKFDTNRMDEKSKFLVLTY